MQNTLHTLNKRIMSLSPQVLLSSFNRKECVSKMKELPVFKNSKTIKEIKQNASVLVPLCVENGEVSLLYTLRSSKLKKHSGQVSFPGGKLDKDEDVFVAALRETEEEIGVPQSEVDIWGEMPAVLGRNNEIFITPVVGEIINFDSSKLIRNEDEVEEIFTVPMKNLCDPKNHAYFEFNKIPMPIFLSEKHKIWGITGYITHIFLQCFLPSDVYKVDFMRKKFHVMQLIPGPKL